MIITSLLWLFGITALGLLLFLAWGVWKGWDNGKKINR